MVGNFTPTKYATTKITTKTSHFCITLFPQFSVDHNPKERKN
jgi:hypothetical protein